VTKSVADAAPGQGNELTGEAGEEFARRGVVVGLQARQEFEKGVCHGRNFSRRTQQSLPIRAAKQIYLSGGKLEQRGTASLSEGRASHVSAR
jgi:hypothetical protein